MAASPPTARDPDDDFNHHSHRPTAAQRCRLTTRGVLLRFRGNTDPRTSCGTGLIWYGPSVQQDLRVTTAGAFTPSLENIPDGALVGEHGPGIGRMTTDGIVRGSRFPMFLAKEI